MGTSYGATTVNLMVSFLTLSKLSVIVSVTVQVSPTVPPVSWKITSCPFTSPESVVQVVDDELTVTETIVAVLSSQRL
jgi:hypothetical protein